MPLVRLESERGLSHSKTCGPLLHLGYRASVLECGQSSAAFPPAPAHASPIRTHLTVLAGGASSGQRIPEAGETEAGEVRFVGRLTWRFRSPASANPPRSPWRRDVRGPTVQSRNCPSLLFARCSRRSCRFVVAGAARVAGVLLGKGSGSGPAGVRGGSRNALCLQGVSAAFRIRRSLGWGCRVVTPDRIMLAVERAGLAQAGAAAQFGSRSDTGPPLFLGQGLVIHERPRDVY